MGVIPKISFVPVREAQVSTQSNSKTKKVAAKHRHQIKLNTIYKKTTHVKFYGKMTKEDFVMLPRPLNIISETMEFDVSAPQLDVPVSAATISTAELAAQRPY
jgi:hypothetical protein